MIWTGLDQVKQENKSTERKKKGNKTEIKLVIILCNTNNKYILQLPCYMQK